MAAIEEKVAGFLSTFLEKEGFSLLKTEYLTEDGMKYLRVFLDLTNEEKERRGEEAGVGINDCAAVSRRLSKWLDKEDFIPEEYMLEVCSKGYLDQNQAEPEDGKGEME